MVFIKWSTTKNELANGSPAFQHVRYWYGLYSGVIGNDEKIIKSISTNISHLIWRKRKKKQKKQKKQRSQTCDNREMVRAIIGGQFYYLSREFLMIREKKTISRGLFHANLHGIVDCLHIGKWSFHIETALSDTCWCGKT